jgi:Tol biopolymer transport system component
VCLFTLVLAATSARADDKAAAPETKVLAPVGEESRYLANITQLTFAEMGFHKAGEAYFSPDAKSIVFQAVPAGKADKDRYQIYTMDMATRKVRMISAGRGACTCAYFRPDGKKVIFASSHHAPDPDKPLEKKPGGYAWDFDEHMDVFEADVDGGNLKRLTDAPGYDAECAYSPDGSQIVFTSQRDGDLEIYVMNADGTNQRRLTEAKGYDGGPFFSPDGKTILYRGDRRDDDKMNLQIRMIDATGRNDRAITDNPIFNWCPYWHPSGKFFIFTQADHEAYARGSRPNYDLLLMSLDGQRTERITFDDNFDGLPVFSPDGRKLMWTSKRGGLEEAQVFIADFTLPTGWE